MSTFVSASSALETTENWVDISKPTGLEVGHTMIAGIFGVGTSASFTINSPEDWELIETQNLSGSQKTLSLYSKLADADDVAATDFRFTISIAFGSYQQTHGGILAFSDFGAVLNTAKGTGSSFAGFTPDRPDSLFIFLGGCTDSVDASPFGTVAIATDNPIWTTRASNDANVQPEIDSGFAIITATRPAQTATGTITLTDSGNNRAGIMLAVAPIINGSVTDVSDSLHIVTPPSPEDAEVTVNAPEPTTNSTEFTVWTNEATEDTTWTNEQL